MKIYLVEVLKDPVLLVINIYFILLNCITQLSHAFANLGFKDLWMNNLKLNFIV